MAFAVFATGHSGSCKLLQTVDETAPAAEVSANTVLPLSLAVLVALTRGCATPDMQRLLHCRELPDGLSSVCHRQQRLLRASPQRERDLQQGP